MSIPVLSVRGLCANGTGNWRAVSDVTFDVNEGECVVIIGPNGSGKSSLLKGITREYKTVEGDLLLSGICIKTLDKQQLAKKVAVVSQNENVDPRLRVIEYVRLGRTPHTFCCTTKEHSRAVNQAIEDVGLAHKSEHCFGELSGGERQRASIARAFAQEPRLLLLDEPTNHLDPLARLELLSLIKQRGIASVMVLHDLPLVSPFADRVLLMSDQKMVTFATPDVVMQDQFMTSVFGLRVISSKHPNMCSTIHHFEAASSFPLSFIGIPQ
ncbi:ABC transporter ATP-binding protein [Vibrio mediterranei]|uniref:ABC transporter ATP-binding protein n=1 Tax=Vibrio mediterranei TaxID=689 RepID=UPI001EFD5962|nr:ABC transporter ATP-binding protein [Vibrio mediterranei]MCG9628653.1 ABC transporter ATP-binding protein [Vibrio mediterranei]